MDSEGQRTTSLPVFEAWIGAETGGIGKFRTYEDEPETG